MGGDCGDSDGGGGDGVGGGGGSDGGGGGGSDGGGGGGGGVLYVALTVDVANTRMVRKIIGKVIDMLEGAVGCRRR
ncbi:hypothetical protein Tco_1535656, partial [Tanacetum coccineum]